MTRLLGHAGPAQSDLPAPILGHAAAHFWHATSAGDNLGPATIWR